MTKHVLKPFCRWMPFLVAVVMFQGLAGQELKVVSELKLTQRQEAVKYERVDFNGVPCAVVVLILDDDNLDFEGDIRSTQYRGNGEWWLWMTEDASWLTVKSNSYTPLRMEFAPLKNGKTYEVRVEPASPMQMLVVTDPFHADPTMTDATKRSRLDANRRICGLARIGLVLPEAQIKGAVHSVYQGGEWWVWLAPGSRQLTITSQGYQPLVVDFEPVKSSVTYLMTIQKASAAPTPSMSAAPESVAQGYTDLGLPSGTKWKTTNEDGHYPYDEAVSKFGSSLPSKEQWEELMEKCRWSWTGSEYKVTGPNGNSISLPAAGFRDCSGRATDVGSFGCYWSSTPKDSGYAWELGFNSGSVSMYYYYRCNGQSVRLVQD